jgi:DNA-3-methyladenine glycosylase I
MAVPDPALVRCSWCDGSDLYRAYHDQEWGFPVADERLLFELLSLELFQSGLSWLTILKRREGFRRGFAGFEIDALSRFGEPEVLALLQDEYIIRHRGKIEAVIRNARAALALRRAGGSLAALLWSHAGPADAPPALAQARTPASTALAATLKRQGWVWLGPTTLHAFMQAAGLVNDHAPDCHARAAAMAARRDFQPPG